MGNCLFDSITYPALGVEFLGITQFVGNHRGQHADVLFIEGEDIRRLLGINKGRLFGFKAA